MDRTRQGRFVAVGIGGVDRKARMFEGGRVCAAVGCGTRLSVYNAQPLCWQHEAPHPYVVRSGRRRRRASNADA